VKVVFQPGAKPGDDRDDRHGGRWRSTQLNRRRGALVFQEREKLRTGHLFLKFQ